MHSVATGHVLDLEAVGLFAAWTMIIMPVVRLRLHFIIIRKVLASKVQLECWKKVEVAWGKIRRISGDFDTRDKERRGRPIKFEDAELEALLDEDSSQTQEERSETLGVTQQAISNRLKVMGMVQKQGNWVPYELKPGNIERRICTCELLLKRQNRKHDNARPHVAKIVKETLEALQWDVLPHPPYSPDIAPSDYHIFR
ncbi:hypothetical protein LAZ67_7002670 [Cordylochernes scorpioides]|uniref:Mariner Mos1 transposase n=1 Tax=Cordylochernes scorpioides TaxID=51811 RepID=A0ABY6KNE0_9ARAC|nr:hypothetical protein LAZ67_7002670 [Cordylochernes scorpioides]